MDYISRWSLQSGKIEGNVSTKMLKVKELIKSYLCLVSLFLTSHTMGFCFQNDFMSGFGTPVNYNLVELIFAR